MTINIPEALLPPTTTAAAVAPILNMSASSVYAAIKSGEFPFPALRIGGRIVIPTAPIREALGFTDEPQAVA
ncbi:helix-turn-helix transcriptional regulator [Corynebacterium hansenii]|uniref:Helix-turn-helix transcriptional regulator n=1 Tax=Corynebacterium hansenii TaxID=394964 RepID=A0ABV7ZP52_9CORY|nr:helix-turn-helix domain-containing protein [Corynebacterium hansenii]WJZ00489.1 hypothetical protein CHAN_09425 [Corynebacterium hansenii]